MQAIFLPVPLYFAFTLLSQIKNKGQNQESLSLRKKTTLVFIILFFLMLSGSIVGITKTNKQEEFLLPSPIPTSTSSPAKEKAEKKYIVIKTDEENVKVNIREEASKSAKILLKASNGQKFALQEIQKEWYKILLDNGSFGYIHKDFAYKEQVWEK